MLLRVLFARSFGFSRVQVVPSVDVTMIPAVPKATNFVPFHATPLKVFVVFDVREDQAVPFDDE